MQYGTATIVIEGNIGRAAEVRDVGENQVVEFSVAVSKKLFGKEAGKDENGYPKKRTDWYTVKSWMKNHVKLAEFLVPGTVVSVVGELDLREFERRDNGGKGIAIEIKPYNINFLASAKSKGTPTTASSSTETAQSDEATSVHDDLPF